MGIIQHTPTRDLSSVVDCLNILQCLCHAELQQLCRFLLGAFVGAAAAGGHRGSSGGTTVINNYGPPSG